MKKSSFPSVLIVIAAGLWALDGVLRRSLFTLPSITIVFYEHLFGVSFLIPFIYRELAQVQWTKKIVGLSLSVAMLSGVLGTLWFTQALAMISFIPFSVVILLQKLQPLFAITTAALFLKEKVTPHYLQWSSLALVAAFFTTFPLGKVDIANSASLLAALLAVGAAAAWGGSTTLSKLLLKEVSADSATALRFMFTTVLALLGVGILGKTASLGTVTLSQVMTLCVISLSTGMVALWLYYKGLKTTKAQVATILELTFPMLAVLIDAVVYKVFLHPTQYLAAVVLLIAMFKVSSLQAAQSGGRSSK